MELKSYYKKLTDGRIFCKIDVVKGEDYPARCIFSNSCDYPSNEGYVLEPKNQSVIEGTFASVEEAIEWVDKEITALKQHLQRWREITVPEGATYII